MTGYDSPVTAALRPGFPPLTAEMAALVREELSEMVSYHPHAGSFAVRLDANEAPPFWSREAQARLAAAALEGALERYPDTRATALKEALCARAGALPEELVVGVGSDEVIALLLTALGRPRGRGRPTVLTVTPTFVMYRTSARARGFHVIEAPLDAEWQLSVPSMKRAIETADPHIIFIASPNNPTGGAMREDALREVIEAAPRSLVVLDEAYAAYGDADLARLFVSHPNVALLGTLSKIGLAAARIGWLRASPALVDEIDKVRQPYNVPSVTQRIAIVALTELAGEIAAAVALVRGERARLTAEIERLGHRVTPSDANFLWIRTLTPAADIFARLAERSVLVRSFHERGGRLASQIRVTVGTPQDNDRFLSALAACV